MSIEEKAAMLTIVALALAEQLKEALDNVMSYIKTYPELTQFLTVICDVTLDGKPLIECQLGKEKLLKACIDELVKEVNKDE